MNIDSLQTRRFYFINNWRSHIIQFISYLFIAVGVLSVVVLVLDLVHKLPDVVIGLATVFCSPLLLFASINLYANYLFNNPRYGIGQAELEKNPVNRLDYAALELLIVLNKCSNLATFWSQAKSIPIIQEVLFRLSITDKAVAELYGTNANSDIANSVLNSAIALSGGNEVTIFFLLRVLLAEPAMVAYLTREKVNSIDVELLIGFYESRQQARSARKGVDLTGGIGKSWSVSYTNLLDEVAEMVPADIERFTLLSPIYSREVYVERITMELLKGSSTNILLTGESGIGKTEIFYHFAAKVMHYKTQSELDGRDVRVLDVERLLSLAKSQSELQQIIANLFGELSRAGNVILFVKNINLLLSPDEKIGSVDIGNLLEGYLENSAVKIIGTLTAEEYLETIKPNAVLNGNFTQIEITQPSLDEMPGIILSQIAPLEYRYNCYFSLSAMKDLIVRAGRFIKDQASPTREIRLAEEVAAEAHAENSRVVTDKIVDVVVERIAKVPIEVADDEKNILLNLSAKLHERIVGQDLAIKEISDALLRARAGITTENRPVGSFLFLGPTGVGKTETAKALAQIYYGDKVKMVRLDMSEFADESSLAKLLGSNQVTNPGALTEAIQENPSTVLLFDEIEKSNNLVKNALLQILDEGKVTTNYGKVLDFSNTIIIATSNAGSDYIRTQIQAGLATSAFEKQLIDTLISQKIFLPEFLNRFDGIIVYTPLSQDEIKQVVVLEATKLSAQLEKEKGITLKLSDAVIGELARRGYDPVFGARALRRVLENDLETKIAKQIITDSPQPGTVLTIDSLD